MRPRGLLFLFRYGVGIRRAPIGGLLIDFFSTLTRLLEGREGIAAISLGHNIMLVKNHWSVEIDVGNHAMSQFFRPISRSMNIALISLYEKYYHQVPRCFVCLFPDFRCFSYYLRN